MYNGTFRLSFIERFPLLEVVLNRVHVFDGLPFVGGEISMYVH